MAVEVDKLAFIICVMLKVEWQDQAAICIFRFALHKSFCDPCLFKLGLSISLLLFVSLTESFILCADCGGSVKFFLDITSRW